MKKIFLTLIAVLAISIYSANAQAVWGARVGFSMPTVSESLSGPGMDKFTDKVKGQFGLELGPVLYYSLKGNFYLNPSLMFSIKTFDYGVESLKMYYADIPLYAGYNIPAGKVSFYAQAGPFVGFKLGESKETSLKSLNAGIGAIFGVSIKKFKIELGYQQGLMNVAKLDDEDKDKGYTYKAKLSSIFIGINYVF
ncbi:MAG: PorT family protein [Prevotellaceae bacterium]|jgi:hypothetical protein|nr:PorT family protein [Prevotellaceae bacterium]